MKLLSLLFLSLIIWHQTTLEVINGILFFEIIVLVLFYILGQRYVKTRKRKMDTKNHLQSYRRPYSDKVNKDWREYRSNIKVKPEKETIMEMLQ